MVDTCTMQQSFGLGPRGPDHPHGAQQGPGAQQAPNGAPGAPRPEEQHHKPFFYIQPSQPYLPLQGLQWSVPVPVPVSYSPYYGYPGYGMPVMPGYQSYPYMEPPSFVVPHTHLHLMDYRRMLNPQYYQTMAYQSRKFRYQHNSQGPETTNSEVQTEPLSGPGPPQPEASLGPSPPSSQQVSSSVSLQDDPSSRGSFVIQTEEVRIECCATPAGLQLLRSHEAAGVSRSFSQDLAQCGSVLPGLSAPGAPEDPSEQGLRACPDILLVGTPKGPPLEDPSAGRTCSRETEKDAGTTPGPLQRAARLPFDPQYLDELRKMESMVWATEETLIPSPESFMRNDYEDSNDEKLVHVPVTHVPVTHVPVTHVPVTHVPTTTEEPPANGTLAADGSGAEERVQVEAPGTSEAPSEVGGEPYLKNAAPQEEGPQDVAPALLQGPQDVAPALLQGPQDVASALLQGPQDVAPALLQDPQDSSFESLPASLPSASWLADFGGSRRRCGLQEQNRPPSRSGSELPTRRRKLDLECGEQAAVHVAKERYESRGAADRRSLSDHECCLRTFCSFAPGPKRDRVCTQCLAKRTLCPSPGPGPDGHASKRKAAPPRQRDDAPLPTCGACVRRSKKRAAPGSISDVGVRRRGRDTEAESSENSCGRARTKCRAAARRPSDPKRPLASKQNLVTVLGAAPKPGGRSCVCGEPPCPSVVRERLLRCPHGNATQEMDENCAAPLSLREKWKHVDPFYHQYQREKPWRALIPTPDGDASKRDARLQHVIKHMKSRARAQGSCRKDTRW